MTDYKMTFQETIGREIPVFLWKTMREYNVSPADFDELFLEYRENWHAMQRGIVKFSHDGMFSQWSFLQATYAYP